jgi:hypothetical protein
MLTIAVTASLGAAPLPADDPLTLLTAAAPDARVDVPYTLNLLATGGVPPYTWDNDGSNAIPFWLDLDAETGILQGIPDEADTYVFAIAVHDRANPPNVVSRQFTLNVLDDDGGVAFETVNLPPAFRGAAYAEPVLAHGGDTPYTWTISDDVLPDGLVFSTNIGWFYGHPTVTGAAFCRVTVHDDNGDSASRDFSIHVLDPCQTAPIILPAALPPAYAGVPIAIALSAIGLTTPVWSTFDDLPDGVALDDEGGVLYGTPERADVFAFTIEAEDPLLDIGVSRPYYWAVTQMPGNLTLAPAALPTVYAGLPYQYTLTAMGGTPPHVFSLAEGCLPSGIVFHTQTGTLLGQTAATGDFWFVARVSDYGGLGVTALQFYQLHVRYATKLDILTAHLPDARVGRAYNIELQHSSGKGPFAWSLANGAVPPGMTLHTDGILAGTPLVSTALWFTLRVDSRGDGQSAIATRRLCVHEKPQHLAIDTALLPDGTVGAVYNTLICAHGGIPPYDWSIVAGAPPPGVALMPETGLLGGAPIVTGTFDFVVQLRDQEATVVYRSFSFNVAPVDSGLRFISTVLPAARVGHPYNARISVTGGDPPYAWHIVNGDLPPGLALSTNTGSIIGTPTCHGAYTFIVHTFDVAQHSIARQFTLRVERRLAALRILTDTLEEGEFGEEYRDTIVAEGGRLPYTWSVSAGALPSGLSLHPTQGVLSGTPTDFGVWAASITVVDKLGSNDVHSYVLRILNADELAIATETLPHAKVGCPYRAELRALGGNPPLRWSVAAGTLPPGLILDADSGVITGSVLATANTYESYLIDIMVEDDIGDYDLATFEVLLDTLDVLSVPNASFRINWDYDKCDMDMVALRFIVGIPPDFTAFIGKEALCVTLGDYNVEIDSCSAYITGNGLGWRAKYGDPRIQDGFRNDVPVVAATLRANPKKGVIVGRVVARFDDGIGSDLLLDEDVIDLISKYPVAVTFSIGQSDFVGHAGVPIKYKRNRKGTRGVGRSFR